MPVGYGAQCKVCNSPHRAEIDRRLLAGETVRAVAAWLSSIGEPTGKSSVASHKASHLAVLQEARERVAKASKAAAEPVFEEAVQKVVAEVGLLDEMASIGAGVVRSLQDEAKAGNLTMPQVALFNGCMKETREAVKTKHELLEGQKVTLEGGLAEFLAAGFGEDDEPDDAPQEASGEPDNSGNG
jgi:hypothetical protein